jgi:hypothetical protein
MVDRDAQSIDPYVVNGKRYSLWPQFVQRQFEYIGGKLEELPGDGPGAITTITAIRFEPNGKDSAAFFVDGVDFGCGSDVQYLAVDPKIGGDGWIGFSSYGGHRWRIRKKEVIPGN